MADHNCRIGKVTYKSGAIHSLPDKRLHGHKANILSAARQVVNDLPDVDGYVILAWEKPKQGIIKAFYEPGANRDLLDLPAYAAELIRWTFQSVK